MIELAVADDVPEVVRITNAAYDRGDAHDAIDVSGQRMSADLRTVFRGALDVDRRAFLQLAQRRSRERFLHDIECRVAPGR